MKPPSTHSAVPDPRNAEILISINGDLVPRAEARISVFDSGFLVGDGIWEGIRLHHGELAFLDRHLDRLFGGLEQVSLDPGLDRAGLTARIEALLTANGMIDGVHVRVMVTRGDKVTPSQHPSNCVGPPNIVIIAEHKRADPTVRDRGISLATVSVRRPPPDTLDQRLNCHSKLHEVVALIEATNTGADEALMLDTTGAVATCNATNFFCVRNTSGTPGEAGAAEVWTSTSMHSLPGITRAVVCEVAAAAGLVVHEAPFTIDDVYAADECFVTGTFGGLTPVHTLDGVDFPRRAWTNHLRSLYDAAVAADVDDRITRRAG